MDSKQLEQKTFTNNILCFETCNHYTDKCCNRVTVGSSVSSKSSMNEVLYIEYNLDGTEIISIKVLQMGDQHLGVVCNTKWEQKQPNT